MPSFSSCVKLFRWSSTSTKVKIPKNPTSRGISYAGVFAHPERYNLGDATDLSTTTTSPASASLPSLTSSASTLDSNSDDETVHFEEALVDERVLRSGQAAKQRRSTERTEPTGLAVKFLQVTAASPTCPLKALTADRTIAPLTPRPTAVNRSQRLPSPSDIPSRNTGVPVFPSFPKRVVSASTIVISAPAIVASAQPIQLAQLGATSTSASYARSPPACSPPTKHAVALPACVFGPLTALPSTKPIPTCRTKPFVPLPAPSLSPAFLQRNQEKSRRADLLILQLEAESAERAQQELARRRSAFNDDSDAESEDEDGDLSNVLESFAQVTQRVPQC
ncbi:hypothetical protein JCM11641_002654 [Rhodosporidiobolus odoratus]